MIRVVFCHIITYYLLVTTRNLHIQHNASVPFLYAFYACFALAAGFGLSVFRKP